MKRKFLIPSLLFLGIILNPIKANAWGPSGQGEYKLQGNVEYKWTNADRVQLESTTFVDGALIPQNPQSSGSGAMYNPNQIYGKTQLMRIVDNSIYGDPYFALVPQGYYKGSLVENSQNANNADRSCVANTTSQQQNNFKIYSNPPNSIKCPTGEDYGGTQTGPNGAYGNWRYLGYNSWGQMAVPNPNFPSDYPGVTGVGGYNWNKYYAINSNSIFDTWEHQQHKYNAMQKAMVQSSFGNPNDPSSVQEWMNTLRLLTDPTQDTPIFKGTRKDGARYRSVTGVTEPALVRDLEISRMEIFDGNRLIGLFTRDTNGNVSYSTNSSVSPNKTYRYNVTVRNIGNGEMQTNSTNIMTGVATGSNAFSEDQLYHFSNNNYNSNQMFSGYKTAAGRTQTISFSKTLTNVNANDTIRLTANIDEGHYALRESNDLTNDWAKLNFRVETGDTSVQGINLMDENGNYTSDTAPVPGKKYRYKYIFKYAGPDILQGKDDVYNPNRVVFNINTTVARLQNDNNTNTNKESHRVAFNEIRNGDTFSVVTKTPLLHETPISTASVTMSGNLEVDNDSSNNSMSESYRDNYDIIVSNVRITNKEERPVKLGEKIKVGVKYDIEYRVPSYVRGLETDVFTKINSNVEFVDHIKQGMNKDIVKEIEIIPNGIGSLNVEVSSNNEYKYNGNKKYGLKYENNYNNNNASTNANEQFKVVAPENPYNGGCTLNSKNNVNITKAQPYGNYKASLNKYPTSNGNRNYYKYSDSGLINQNVDFNEKYQVEDVLFKSKFTQDKGWGDKGWISVKNEPKKVIVKAGYGYELKVVTKYNSNTITGQRKEARSKSSVDYLYYEVDNDNNAPSTIDGTFVRNLNVPANYQDDIYIKTEDNKVFSKTGLYGSYKKFDSKIENNGSEIKTTYTLNGEKNKIFVQENTKDGKYDISVFTPNITGSTQNNLCDKFNFKLEVRGSMIDDIVDQTVQ